MIAIAHEMMSLPGYQQMLSPSEAGEYFPLNITGRFDVGNGECEPGETSELNGNKVKTCIPIDILEFVESVAQFGKVTLSDQNILNDWYVAPNDNNKILDPGKDLPNMTWDSWSQQYSVIIPTPDGVRTILLSPEQLNLLMNEIPVSQVTQITQITQVTQDLDVKIVSLASGVRGGTAKAVIETESESVSDPLGEIGPPVVAGAVLVMLVLLLGTQMPGLNQFQRYSEEKDSKPIQSIEPIIDGIAEGVTETLAIQEGSVKEKIPLRLVAPAERRAERMFAKPLSEEEWKERHSGFDNINGYYIKMKPPKKWWI